MLVVGWIRMGKCKHFLDSSFSIIVHCGLIIVMIVEQCSIPLAIFIVGGV